MHLTIGRLLTATTYTVVAASTTAAASQSLVLAEPAPGFEDNYVAFVTGARNAPGTTSTTYVLRSGLVEASSNQGAFTVEPKSSRATAGTPFALTASWSGRAGASVPYVGWIEYPNGQGTVVTVN